MREIKFRAWFTKRQEMVNVETMNLFSTCVEVGAKVDHEKGGWYTQISESTNRKTALPGSTRQVPRVVLMQYTGIKDSKGNEVYEGDIIKVNKLTFESSAPLPENLTVTYYGGMFQFFRGKEPLMGLHLAYLDDGEIIGNIFENPELITA